MRAPDPGPFADLAIRFEGETLWVRDEEIGALRPLSNSRRLRINAWHRQTRPRAPGARTGAPEGLARASGIAPHLFTLLTTTEREGIEVAGAPVAGETRFRSTRFDLKPGNSQVPPEPSTGLQIELSLFGEMRMEADTDKKAILEAIKEVAPRYTAALTSTLTLLLVALLFRIAAGDSSVEVPLLKVEVPRDRAVELTSFLAAASYFMMMLYNSYRRLLEEKLSKEKPLSWEVRFPTPTVYLAHAENISPRFAVLATIVFLALGIALPLALAGSALLPTDTKPDIWHWLSAAGSLLFIAMGGWILGSALTPARRDERSPEEDNDD